MTIRLGDSESSCLQEFSINLFILKCISATIIEELTTCKHSGLCSCGISDEISCFLSTMNFHLMFECVATEETRAIADCPINLLLCQAHHHHINNTLLKL